MPRTKKGVSMLVEEVEFGGDDPIRPSCASPFRPSRASIMSKLFIPPRYLFSLLSATVLKHSIPLKLQTRGRPALRVELGSVAGPPKPTHSESYDELLGILGLLNQISAG